MTEESCTEVARRLSAWIDGELDAPTAASVREHLAACVSCQRRKAVLGVAGRAIRGLPEERVSDGFEEAFRRRLAAARAGASGPRGRSPVLLAAAGLAAALVLAVIGSLALPRLPAPGAARPTSSNSVPRWLATCGAPTAADCQREAPCASAAACGVIVLYGEPSPSLAAARGEPTEAPCASAAVCRVVSVVPADSAGRFSPTPSPGDSTSGG